MMLFSMKSVVLILLSLHVIRTSSFEREVSYDAHFPHIPWEVLRLANPRDTEEENCIGNPTTLLWTMVCCGGYAVPGYDVSSQPGSACPARLVVTSDSTRWPRVLVTVQCACERQRCSGRATHHCITLIGPVSVLRQTPNSGREMVPTLDMVPIGCICAARSSMQAHVIQPNIE